MNKKSQTVEIIFSFTNVIMINAFIYTPNSKNKQEHDFYDKKRSSSENHSR